MVDWVENGNAPNDIIAVKYTNNNATQGVQFTRKLCPVSVSWVQVVNQVELTGCLLSIRKRQDSTAATRTRPTPLCVYKRLESRRGEIARCQDRQQSKS